ATATASSNAGPEAINVVEVSAPAAASSAMARLMPRVRPKSSALRMRRIGKVRGARFEVRAGGEWARSRLTIDRFLLDGGGSEIVGEAVAGVTRGGVVGGYRCFEPFEAQGAGRIFGDRREFEECR